MRRRRLRGIGWWCVFVLVSVVAIVVATYLLGQDFSGDSGDRHAPRRPGFDLPLPPLWQPMVPYG